MSDVNGTGGETLPEMIWHSLERLLDLRLSCKCQVTNSRIPVADFSFLVNTVHSALLVLNLHTDDESHGELLFWQILWKNSVQNF